MDNALFRLYASRGPGGFTPNPYASIGPQLYLVISALKSKPEALYKGGAKIGFSKVAVKSGGMARYQQTREDSCHFEFTKRCDLQGEDLQLHFQRSDVEGGFGCRLKFHGQYY